MPAGAPELAAGLSKNQIRQLGRRLREQPISQADDELLTGLLEEAARALAEVEDDLRNGLDLRPVGRVKSRGTLIDKLRRGTELDRIQDLAGTRLIVNGGLDLQDAIVDAVAATLPECKVLDRRKAPSYGYRAVHLVRPQRGLLVEVQVRTYPQHRWAELMERLGDEWGRGVRYGGALESTGTTSVDAARRHAVAAMMQLTDLIAAEEVSARAVAVALAEVDLRRADIRLRWHLDELRRRDISEGRERQSQRDELFAQVEAALDAVP